MDHETRTGKPHGLPALIPGWRLLPVVIAALLLQGCLGMPAGVTPVEHFELERYLGKWYEIARLDHSFERGMSNVTAEYSLRGDGGVRVVNRGFLDAEQRWELAEGRAYFVDGPDKGYLRVAFFGPFYGSYVVFELDQGAYGHAFVSGPDTGYLWLLARSPQVDPALVERFVARAESLGFDTTQLIFPKHDRQETVP